MIKFVILASMLIGSAVLGEFSGAKYLLNRPAEVHPLYRVHMTSGEGTSDDNGTMMIHNSDKIEQLIKDTAQNSTTINDLKTQNFELKNKVDNLSNTIEIIGGAGAFFITTLVAFLAIFQVKRAHV